MYNALQTNSPDLDKLVEIIQNKYSNDVNLSYYSGIYYERNKKFELAEKQFSKCIKLNPNFVPPYFNLITYYTTQNNSEKTEELLTTIIKMKNKSQFESGGINDDYRMHAYAILAEEYRKQNNKKIEKLLLNLIEFLNKIEKWEYHHVETWKKWM